MHKVRNQKVIRRIADRTRKSARGKNIIAVLAIALTALLFTTVFTVGGSIMDKQQRATMRQVGTSSHAGFKYLTQAEYDIVKKDKKLKEVSFRIVVGDAVNKELNKLHTEVSFYDDLEARWSFCYPEEGHMPRKKDEIVLSDLVLEALGLPCEIGTKVSLTLDINGVEREDTFTLCGYFEGDRIALAQVAAVSEEYARETAPSPVKSVMDQPVDSSDYAGRIMADFNFATSINLEKQAKELAVRCGFPEDVDTGVNWAYMGMEIDLETAVLIGILLFVIFLSGYLIIYNIFYINVFQDIRYYGLLKTIGTTGKQLKKIVRRQAYMLSLVGIPIGLLGGVGIGKLVLPVLIGQLKFSSTTADTKITLNIWIFAGAALFSFATVYISCIKPCRIASRVSPVEAIRFTERQEDTENRRRRKEKTVKGKKTKRVSAREMALQNIKRNKKKVVIVTASLSLALILLNSIYNLVTGFDLDKFVSSMTVSDFSVADATVGNLSVEYNSVILDGVTEEFEEALKRRDGIEETGRVYLENREFELNEKDFALLNERVFENPDVQSMISRTLGGEDLMKDYLSQMQNGRWISGKAYGINEMIAGKLEYIGDKNPENEDIWEKLSAGKYVIVNYCRIDEEKQIPFFEPGEKLTLYNAEGEEREYEVLAFANLPRACQFQSYGLIECNYILPEDELLEFFGERQPMRLLFNVDSEHEKETEKWISEYCESVNPDLDYSSKAQIEKEFDSTKNMYVTVGGLLVLILALIGILNFINTMITSILSREQEFAMMEAVGMTGKQLKEMLCFEGAYYAVFTGCVSLVAGSVLNATAVRSVGEEFFAFSWNFTVLPLIICIPVLFFAVLFVPAACYKRMCASSVVERMRKAE